MTETDATKRPLTMPEKFIPYLEKYRIYKVFKDLTEDVIINLPKDHLKNMKIFLGRHLHSTGDIERIMVLVSPDLKIDHPCTVREARCMQQDGVFPTVTLVLSPTPQQAPPAENPLTPSRNFFQQDFEGLKFAYKATLKVRHRHYKDVYIDHDDDIDKISTKCFNAIRACASGLQNTRHGYHVVGAPGVYRVVLIGPRGSGTKTHGLGLAKHFGLIYINFNELYREALERDDEVGEKLRTFGPSNQLKAEIVRRRIMKKDCVDLGWVLTGYPSTGLDFENLDNMPTPPNRIIFLNADMQTCKKRLISRAVDWCTGLPAAPGSGPRVLPHPADSEEQIDNEAAVIAAPAFDIEACAQLRNVRGD
ncbi:hypothetical protein ABMA28_012361 [Loxostege sticticalis]|uniref:Adenylate kinase 8 n=1 Tax=Loxostege sticticalis TaxID=481309 RepID=A0ABD0TMW7_LOXSC